MMLCYYFEGFREGVRYGWVGALGLGLLLVDIRFRELVLALLDLVLAPDSVLYYNLP